MKTGDVTRIREDYKIKKYDRGIYIYKKEIHSVGSCVKSGRPFCKPNCYR
jgi:hypothetical protein